MKILFICSINRMRSITAEEHFRKIHPEHEYDSCGTDRQYIMEYGHMPHMEMEHAKPVSRELVDWADVIITMENHHSDFIRRVYGEDIRRKCYTLNIPDIFERNDPRLKAMLEARIDTGKWI